MSKGSAYTFRVSDALEVPLRGQMLRLRLVDGAPSMKDLAVGRKLRLQGPSGAARDVEIVAHSVTSGNPTQKRLDRNRELDVIVSSADADGAGNPIAIGWTAGPSGE